MRKLPSIATLLLLRLGPQDDSFVGDLVEEYQSGRSRVWYWRQVVTAVVLSSARQLAAHPAHALATVAAGWATTFAIFMLGDGMADGAAGWLWNWNRQVAYATDVWWPFAITASMVSYSGFALSAVVVARVGRRHAGDGGPMLVAYAASMFVVLSVAAVIIEILTARNGRVPVPHPLFYVISVALPYHLRSGLLLAPLVILSAGVVASPARGRTSEEAA
jgi:hypothetical protein